MKHHRENKKLKDEESQQVVNSQKLRRTNEAKRMKMTDFREKEKKEKEANRNRVNKFRLKIRLRDLKTASPDKNSSLDIKDSPGAYKHKSSETRAYKRVMIKMPQTQAETVQILEQLLFQTTRRSKKALHSSVKLQAVFCYIPVRRKVSDNYSIIESLKTYVSESKKQHKNSRQPR